MLLRLASYNIHAGVGGDGRFAPRRLAAVLHNLDADIIGLQEVVSIGPDGFALLDELARRSGMQAIAGPTMLRGDASYGNALLLRPPYRNLRRLELDAGRHEPRGAVSVEISAGGEPLTVAVTHLGLRAAERRQQIALLLEWLPAPPARVVLLGDLNEWWPWSANLRRLRRRFGTISGTATFPARLPLLAMDRILASPAHLIRWQQRQSDRLSRLASDHLPVLAEIDTAAVAQT